LGERIHVRFPSSRSAGSYCTFFRGNSGVGLSGAMNNYWKYLLDGALVVLIFVLL
jgi:hypothetical protein